MTKGREKRPNGGKLQYRQQQDLDAWKGNELMVHIAPDATANIRIHSEATFLNAWRPAPEVLADAVKLVGQNKELSDIVVFLETEDAWDPSWGELI
jgi:hypothetical protein